jgi:uncharacterized protein (TIGR02757 family)
MTSKQLDLFSAESHKEQGGDKKGPILNPLKDYLDGLVVKYKTPDFIPKDPIKFPHRFTDPADQEVIGLISSIMAQGRRTMILQSMEKICQLMDGRPYQFVADFNPEVHASRFDGFVHFAYRNITGGDIACVVYLLKQALRENDSLKKLFLKGLDTSQKNIRETLTNFVEYLHQLSPLPGQPEIPGSVRTLVPSPRKGSACKRLNMYLRWMVRSDEVDLGLWREVPKSMLVIPLDFHVSRLARELGLTERKADDWRTAEEITDHLREFDPDDPAKYDFAIFGMGVSGEKPSEVVKKQGK